MRVRVLLAVLAACVGIQAQTVLNVEQLESFIRSSIQLKHPDKQVASFLSKVRLSEQLDARTIEDLQGSGAGLKTVEALKQLGEASKSLPKPPVKAVKPAPSPIPPPDSEEQARVIDEARSYAINYSRTLPDFICTQVTRRYFDPSGLEFWQIQDTLTTRLSYFEQKEDYKLILVNNRMTDRPYESLGGAMSTGEFGTMLRVVFERKSEATFQWERWATLRRHRAHVYSYRISQANSQWHVSYERTQEIVPAIHGLVYVDRDTNSILRLTLEAEDIPPSFPIQQASTVLDYDFTKIGDRDYQLPLRAVVRMRTGKLLTKNEVEFRNYRKFSAEAVVSFETPEPLPETETKEEAPK
jgi:hypothetical protein